VSAISGNRVLAVFDALADGGVADVST